MKVTASKTDLLFACRYSLRDDVASGYDPLTAASEQGREVHSAIEAMIDGNTPETHADVANAVGLWLGMTYSSRQGMHAEAALAWDPTSGTGVVLGRHREAYREAPAGWLCGCADLLVVHPDRIGRDAEIDIIDWKTGEFGADKARMQLRTLAVMAAAAFGVGRVNVSSVLVDPEGKRVPEARVSETLGPLELAEHADALRTGLAQIDGAEPVLGDHCRECFCNQQGSCPARAALVESATADLVQLGRRNPLTAPIESDADAAALVQMLPHIEGYIKRRKAEAQAYVEALGGELRVSDTHVYRKTRVNKSGHSAPKVLELAKRLGATQDELAQCLTDSSYDRWSLIKKGA